MSHLLPQNVNPHHTGQAGARHRFWAVSAVLIMGTVLVVGFAGWLVQPPPSAEPPTVIVTLPPNADTEGAPAAASTADQGLAAPETPAAPVNQAGDSAPPQIALPPDMKPPPREQPAWLRFATAAPVNLGDKPRVAIVIDDLGLDRPRTARVIALAPAVTLSFLAYSDDLPRLTEAARRAGHELIVHVPMEPVSTKLDMGPNGLATNQSKEEVLRRLNWDLGRFDGYVGINNHMGSRFTGDAQAMGWVIDELRARGLMFLDSRTIATTIAAKTAAADGVPFAERDVFLDDEQTATAVDQHLKELEAIAKRKGTAVAIGHPHDATIAALASWIAGLPQKGIVLVPLTEVVKARLGLR